MIPFERRKQILDELQKSEIVTLPDFIEVLKGVSESTIRRDLKALEDDGEIVLLRGGAAKLKAGSHEISFTSRNLLNTKEKEQIAKKAADLVADGEIIYIDSGSTALRMIKYIKFKDVLIVTANALVPQELEGAKARCILIGGDLVISTGSVLGSLTENTLRGMFFDKAFLGASGYSAGAGINTPDIREASKKQIVKANSKDAYILLDSGKAGISTMCKVFELKDVSIICDKMTPELQEAGRYMIAE